MRDGGYSFSQVPVADIPRSVFNRSHGHKTTFDAGKLIPIFVDEALPGDTFTVNASMFARLATPIVPIMDNMTLDVFFFSVPNRLLWTNWQKFMGEQVNPGDSTDFLVPQVTAPASTGWVVQGIADYFGLPLGIPNLPCSALPFRAYKLIWNEWFRDENLQNSQSVPKGDGPDDGSTYSLYRRGKRHDYFTSCLPWPQKGAGVELSIGGYADVIPQPEGGPEFSFQSQGAAPNTKMYVSNAGAPTITGNVTLGAGGPDFGTVYWGDDTGLRADLSTATGVTINSLRQAFQIQKLLERDARGGTRYVEILRSHFGVISPDARLQRPEYLGGGSIPVIFNPVTQTAPKQATGTVTPQGNLAAYAVAGGHGIGFSKSFVEHCTIIGLICARADLNYQQGLNRMWSRRTRYDFYWPAFSHLGEQAVLSKEIYCDGTAGDELVFGYQERWAEYRYFPSKITGKFRSTYTTPLDVWHLAQKFTTRPTLGETFIFEDPPVARVIAVPSEPHFLFDSHFNLKCVRPMPTYSVPGLIDHF